MFVTLNPLISVTCVSGICSGFASLRRCVDAQGYATAGVYPSNRASWCMPWVLSPPSNSWIITIKWLYIALNKTPNIACYWVGAVPNACLQCRTLPCGRFSRFVAQKLYTFHTLIPIFESKQLGALCFGRASLHHASVDVATAPGSITFKSSYSLPLCLGLRKLSKGLRNILITRISQCQCTFSYPEYSTSQCPTVLRSTAWHCTRRSTCWATCGNKGLGLRALDQSMSVRMKATRRT